MKLSRALLLGVLWLVTSAARAQAEGFLVPYVAFNQGDNPACAPPTVCEGQRRSFGVLLGQTGQFSGTEQDIGYAKDFFGKVPGVDHSMLILMSNVLVGAGSGRLQPFALFGLGLLRLHTSVTEGTVVTKYDKNAFAWDIGAGVTGYVTRSVGLRADVRQFRTLVDAPYPGNLNGDDKLRFWRATLGLALRF